jgi:hypothetical protein
MSKVQTLKPAPTFNAQAYAWAVMHGDPEAVIGPATLADHIAAEQAAREQVHKRINGENLNFDCLPELAEIEESGGTDGETQESMDMRDWGQDIVDEVNGWQRIVKALFVFRAKVEGKIETVVPFKGE